MSEVGFQPLFALYCQLQKVRASRVGLEVYKYMVKQCFFFSWCFVVSIDNGMGKFVPVLAVERWDATDAWYQKGLPTEALAFQRQKCVPKHKLSKEYLIVMCCRNACRKHKFKLVATENPKNHNHSRLPKETAFLSIITTRKKNGWIQQFLKTSSSSAVIQ
jgi:hypothetical protein